MLKYVCKCIPARPMMINAVGTDYHFGVPATVFETGEVIVLKRSDGSTKFD